MSWVVVPSSMNPNALTATSALTISSPDRSVVPPRPPGSDDSRPNHLPTVAPVPAPTGPSAVFGLVACSAAKRPSDGPGRTEPSPHRDRTGSAQRRSAPDPPQSGTLGPARPANRRRRRTPPDRRLIRPIAPPHRSTTPCAVDPAGRTPGTPASHRVSRLKRPSLGAGAPRCTRSRPRARSSGRPVHRERRSPQLRPRHRTHRSPRCRRRTPNR